jgi:methyltransferase-like protein/SAM-dependent methyltransferase
MKRANRPMNDTYIYDEVPYPSLSFHVTHPDRLATLATLLGMRPPSVERCRVLELGCASGGNLIPMALSLPDSEFVGIDLSERQIADGQATIHSVGLRNVTLQPLNILDVNSDFGQFDYIITHGIYSWVPPVVQDKILEICQQHLAPDGVAYISYNTYPGWYMLIGLREMMLFHTREVTDPMQRVEKARALLEFLADSEPVGNSPHTGLLKAYTRYTKERLLPKEAALLIHDELAEVNEPLYFYQFAQRAAQHGLRYLAEAEFQTMLASNLPDGVADTLRQIARDTISVEQYMDFVRNRTFRQTLLCHEAIQLTGSPQPDLLLEFYVGSPALPVANEPDIHSKAVEKFQAGDGATFSTDHPITKAGMLYLSRIWPCCVPFKTLLAEATACLNGVPLDPARDVEALAASLLKAYSYSENLVELRVSSPRFVTEIGERPVASPVARFQAKTNAVVTNLRHERIELSRLAHHLLPYLDGSRDRSALLDVLAALVEEHPDLLQPTDETTDDAGQIDERQEPYVTPAQDEILERKLRQFAQAALLVS